MSIVYCSFIHTVSVLMILCIIIEVPHVNKEAAKRFVKNALWDEEGIASLLTII